MSNNKVVVDNWTLELAAKILEGKTSFSSADKNRLSSEQISNLRGKQEIESYSDVSLSPEEVWIGKTPHWYLGVSIINSIRYEMVQALFHLLDLILMYDTLVVDTELTFTWERFASMERLAPMVSKVRLGKATKEQIKSAFRLAPAKDINPLISEGALYYLGMANMLGLDYWASPQRAEFLSKNLYGGFKTGFVTILGELVDEQLKTLVNGLLEDNYLKYSQSTIYFPGFGAAVLSRCNNRKEILQVATDFRQSRECAAFRNWLNEMDEATTTGNLRFISKNIRDLESIVADIAKNLAGADTFHGNVELEIGLSPSLKLGSETINTIFEHFKPKQLHLSFLRHHFYRALEGSNIWFHIWRLFPELQV